MNTAISYRGIPPTPINRDELIKEEIENLEASANDVLEAFSQCSAAKLSFDQEQQIFAAYADGDTAELGVLIHQLIKTQIKEMAEAIS